MNTHQLHSASFFFSLQLSTHTAEDTQTCRSCRPFLGLCTGVPEAPDSQNEGPSRKCAPAHTRGTRGPPHPQRPSRGEPATRLLPSTDPLVPRDESEVCRRRENRRNGSPCPYMTAPDWDSDTPMGDCPDRGGATVENWKHSKYHLAVLVANLSNNLHRNRVAHERSELVAVLRLRIERQHHLPARPTLICNSKPYT